ncbi:hypothetical protein DMC01_07215 [Campylobacter troglodytis]|nr:hypothetical protein DMC01_07215 [Campylobacter troglodytis]
MHKRLHYFSKESQHTRFKTLQRALNFLPNPNLITLNGKRYLLRLNMINSTFLTKYLFKIL